MRSGADKFAHMIVEVVQLPSTLQAEHLAGRVVVVFDVLRATTTMTAALAAGVRKMRLFDSLDAVRSARERLGAADKEWGEALLCGEAECRRPVDFDLGNSPGDFSRKGHGGRVVLMATTNGTRALLAAHGQEGVQPAAVLAGALVNASAVAAATATMGHDVTLLCAGTGGAVAMEDVLGAGAVLAGLGQQGYEAGNDSARMARRLFETCRTDLPRVLADCTGGRNVTAAGLEADIAFAARVDEFDEVGIVRREAERVQLVPFR